MSPTPPYREQSPIWSEVEAAAGRCQTHVWHIALINEQDHRANVYPPVMYDETHSAYYSEFQIDHVDSEGDPLFVPGKYRIVVLDLFDIWGNGTVDLPKAARESITVR